MELRHLRYFLAVAEAQNFTKASQRLRVAQPALGRQVQDLETELGVQLLERSPRGAQLTPAGQAFIPEAKAVLQRAEEAAHVARAFAQGERGLLHLGYAPSPTVELLPRLLHAFQSEAPNVRVILHDLSSDELWRGLQSGKLQLALAVQMPQLPRGIALEPLGRYPFCVAMPTRHSLAMQRFIAVPQLRGQPLVVYTRADYPEYHEMLHRLFGASPMSLNIAEEHDSANSLIAAVEAGRGLALVPSSLACLAGPRLRITELRPAPPPLVVGVAYRRDKLCPAAERFLRLARSLPPAERGAEKKPRTKRRARPVEGVTRFV